MSAACGHGARTVEPVAEVVAVDGIDIESRAPTRVAEFLTGPEGLAILERYGFILPGE
jgi:hypothetical protein